LPWPQVFRKGNEALALRRDLVPAGKIEGTYSCCTQQQKARRHSSKIKRSGLQLLRRTTLHDWQPKNLEKILAGKPCQEPNLTRQACSTCDEDDPAFKKMEKTFGLGRAPAINQQSNHANSEAVHDDSDWDGRQKHTRTLPERSLKKVGCQKT